MRVRPHPHIGLATVTYLFEGAVRHRDSLGNDLLIEPGAVNWMVAGRGISHSEHAPGDSPDPARERLHGIQLWVALPSEKEEAEPSFTHHPSDSFPQIEMEGGVARVLLGEAYGLTSPAAVFSPMSYVELLVDGEVVLPAEHSERALFTVGDGLVVDGQSIAAHTLVVLREGADARVCGEGRAMFLSGESVGPRFLDWNFVSSSKARLEQARDDWRADRFEPVSGDPERIPYPGDEA